MSLSVQKTPMMILCLLLLTVTFASGDINYNHLSGFGPYLIDYSQPSADLAAVLPAAELRLRIGGDETLTDDELKVDKYMRQLRNQIISNDPDGVLYKSLNYGNIYALRKSDLYKLFYDMPKGGNVHLHLKLTGDYSQLIEYLLETYKDRLFVATDNFSQRNRFYLTFAEICTNDCAEIVSLAAYVKSTRNCSIDDPDCRKNFSIYLLENSAFGPDRQGDLNQKGNSYAWQFFEDHYNTLSDVLDLVDIAVWNTKNFVIASGKENIDYMELRTSVNKLYILKGSNQTESLNNLTQELSVYKYGLDEANNFLKNNSLSSVDATLIPTGRKTSNNLEDSIKNTKIAWELSQNDSSHSHIIRTLGYDLVGEEDLGYSWAYHQAVFEMAKQANQKCPVHAGETNWGSGLYRMAFSSHIPGDSNAFSPDNNLLTALQFADSQLVPRIGHGLALAQHPIWLESMRAKGQCVAVMTLSNQILQYVQDLRRHPLSGMINAGLKVTLSVDDPAIYQITFSDEFVAAYISANLDIAALKAMIKNSYHCSLLSEAEKKQKIADWEKKWQAFITKYASVQLPCAQGNCSATWNEALDGAMFDAYKSLHQNSNGKINASTDISCAGGKFVLPQAQCISYCVLAGGTTSNSGACTMGANGATSMIIGQLSNNVLMFIPILALYLFYFVRKE